MKKSYWEQQADNFEDNIFSVHKHDRSKFIVKAIKKLGSKTKTIADLGCGVGAFLPSMATHFDYVLAVDISPKCLKVAAKRCAGYSNITYLALDLATNKKSKSKINLPKYDVGVSVNALISPSLERLVSPVGKL